MKSIKFSHKYKKLYDNTTDFESKPATEAKLIAVFSDYLELLHPSFIEYDTEGLYKLPKSGEYLILIFQKYRGDIFTTCRRSTPRKVEYYEKSIGETFKVVIKE